MDTLKRDRSVTGKSFKKSKSVGFSSSHCQIIPYSDAPMEYTTDFNSKAPRVALSRSTSVWSLGDPDGKRQRRIVSYKVYTAEGKVKSSLNRSLRWVKNKYIELRYGLL
eukprot:c16547_g1_i1 orf=314-640(+)